MALVSLQVDGAPNARDAPAPMTTKALRDAPVIAGGTAQARSAATGNRPVGGCKRRVALRRLPSIQRWTAASRNLYQRSPRDTSAGGFAKAACPQAVASRPHPNADVLKRHNESGAVARDVGDAPKAEVRSGP